MGPGTTGPKMPPATHVALFNPLSGKHPLYVYNEPHNLREEGTQRALPTGSLNPTRGERVDPAPSTDVRPVLQRPRQRGRQGTLNHPCFQIVTTTTGNTYVTPSTDPTVPVRLQTCAPSHSSLALRGGGGSLIIAPISQGRKLRFQRSAVCPTRVHTQRAHKGQQQDG